MIFETLTDKTLLVLHRGGWKRTKAFFRHPRHMMALRAEIERRGLA